MAETLGEISTLKEQILADFPFSRVYSYMLLTNWTYWDTKPEVPSIDRLKETASHVLDMLFDDNKSGYHKDYGHCSTGGFHAYKFRFDGKLKVRLSFEPFYSQML